MSLRSLPPLLPTLPAGIKAASRDDRSPWRQWYKLARWRRIREAQLLADKYRCRMCGRLHVDLSQLVCDHVEPHRGDPVKFWAGPFQTLCADPCHAKIKQIKEQTQW